MTISERVSAAWTFMGSSASSWAAAMARKWALKFCMFGQNMSISSLDRANLFRRPCHAMLDNCTKNFESLISNLSVIGTNTADHDAPQHGDTAPDLYIQGTQIASWTAPCYPEHQDDALSTGRVLLSYSEPQIVVLEKHGWPKRNQNNPSISYTHVLQCFNDLRP